MMKYYCISVRLKSVSGKMGNAEVEEWLVSAVTSMHTEY